MTTLFVEQELWRLATRLDNINVYLHGADEKIKRLEEADKASVKKIKELEETNKRLSQKIRAQRKNQELQDKKFEEELREASEFRKRVSSSSSISLGSELNEEKNRSDRVAIPHAGLNEETTEGALELIGKSISS